MKQIYLIMALIVAIFLISGCGETIAGVGKDVNRMGKGASTFFFRQSN